jgi:hypothetical protein
MSLSRPAGRRGGGELPVGEPALLHAQVQAEPRQAARRLLVVTDSIRQGIPVRVQVLDSTGCKVHEAGGGPAPAKVAAPA